MINEVVDEFSTGNSSVLPVIDIGYDGHDYVRVTPTSDPSNWTTSSQITFQPTTNVNMLYDLSESYISAQIAPYVTSTQFPGVKYYLSSLSTAAVDCTFGTSIVSSCDIMIGDKTIRTVEAPQASFPYVAGIMAILENTNYDNEGTVSPAAWPSIDQITGPPGVSLPNLTAAVGSQSYIDKDASDPFNVCLNTSVNDYSYQPGDWGRRADINYEVVTDVGPPVVTATVAARRQPEPISGNTYYRAELLRRKNLLYSKPVAPLPPAWSQVSLKLPSSLRSLKAKIPGSVSLNISMTRADPLYALHGDAVYEFMTSSGTVAFGNTNPTIVLGFDISRFDLHLKAVRPTDGLINIMRSEARNQLYHYNAYLSRVSTLVTPALSETISFSRRPKAILAAIVNKSYINPTAANSEGEHVSTQSQFNISPTIKSGGAGCCEVSNLVLTLDGKSYPDNQGYTSLSPAGTLTASNDRAFREFKKCLRNPESVKFYQWFNCARVFAFDLTDSGGNIHDFVVKSSGTTMVTLTGNITLPENLDPTTSYSLQINDYVLAVIGVCDGFFGIQDFMQVTTSTNQ